MTGNPGHPERLLREQKPFLAVIDNRQEEKTMACKTKKAAPKTVKKVAKKK